MDPARGEFHTVGMTNSPIATTPAANPATTGAETTTAQRTLLSSRKKMVAAPVQLHRGTNEEQVGAATETFGACKRACQGMAYDLKHWDELPADGVMQRAQLVATRGGRLPYLVLTVSVAFLVFFLVMHVVKWIATRGSRRRSMVMMYDNNAMALPRPPQQMVPPPPPKVQVQPPTVAAPRAPKMTVPIVGPPNMVPQSFA